MRLTDAIPDWTDSLAAFASKLVIGVFQGEGIGPEVVGAALAVLNQVSQRFGLSLELREGPPIGKDAERQGGAPLSPEAIDFCETVFQDGGAILCGPGGGRFVYDLRRRLDLYCKLTPIRPLAAVRDAGPIRADVSSRADLVLVRDNVGGLYFSHESAGQNGRGERRVQSSFAYDETTIRRLLEVALRLAARRRGRVALAVKESGVPETSRLWVALFREMLDGRQLEAEVLEIDNANYQVIAHPGRFDVIVTPNMLGDILADGAAALLASRGMSFSANFGCAGRAVYQTAHGAAYDLAGRNCANPLGQILTTAMMLRESFGLDQAAASIESAVSSVVADGFRTADIATPRCRVVGTCDMGRRVAEQAAREQVSSRPVA